MDKEQIISELKAAIQEAGLRVTDLFGESDLKATEVFKKEYNNAHEHARRIEKVLGEEREKIITLTKSIDEKEGKIKSLNEIVSKTQVKQLFDKAKEARKLDEKEKAYIEKRLNTFKSEKDGEDLKAEFDKFLDEQVNDYIETAKLLGVEVKKEGEKKEDKGAGSGDGKGGEATDFTSPENNDLIPQ